MHPRATEIMLGKINQNNLTSKLVDVRCSDNTNTAVALKIYIKIKFKLIKITFYLKFILDYGNEKWCTLTPNSIQHDYSFNKIEET